MGMNVLIDLKKICNFSLIVDFFSCCTFQALLKHLDWIWSNGENRSPLSPVRRNTFPYLYLDCGRQLCRTETGWGLVLENLGWESPHRENVHNPQFHIHIYTDLTSVLRGEAWSLVFCAKRDLRSCSVCLPSHTFNWFCFSWQESLSEFASTLIFAMPGNAIVYTWVRRSADLSWSACL